MLHHWGCGVQLEWNLDPRFVRPAIVAAGAVIIAAFAYWWFSAPVASTSVSPSVTTTDPQYTVHGVVVHVVGAVRQPGVIELPAGARVIDAVDAAGGLQSGARAGVNLARVLVDGEQIVIGQRQQATTTADGRISINAASAKELEELPGVGPVLAERIVAYRDANGAFANLRELLQVPGIGDAKFAELADAATL